jgi:microcin C transport system permease protein
MKKPFLSPIARKRLRRFIRHRRALASAWIFAAISIAALSADLLANSNPLYIRFNNRSFFPVLRFYPEATFIPGGGAGRPDYKALRQHPLFTENHNNFMIFTPIPYGPAETIDEAKLADQTGSVRIRLLPIAKAANIDVDPELLITRQTAAAFFLGIPPNEDASGKRLDNIWAIDHTLREALQLRFNNESAPAFRVTLAPPYLDEHLVDVSLPPFTPRSRPPRTLRLTLRLSERKERPIRNIAITPGQPILSPPPEWHRIPASDRERILSLTRDTLHTETPFEIEAPPYAYQVTPAADITWPHPPVKGHPLGIDGAGRDVLARIIHGLRVSLFFSLLLVSVSMTLEP